MKQSIIIIIAAMLAAAGLAGAQMFAQLFGGSTAEPGVLTFTYATTYPATISLGTLYAGPKTASAALYRSGDGAWQSYTGKVISLSSRTLQFKGDWKNKDGAMGYMFKDTFKAAAGSVSMTGGLAITGAYADYMFVAMFAGCTGLSGPIPSGLFGTPSGAAKDYMFYQLFLDCSNITGPIPSGLLGTPSGAPKKFMFGALFSGCSKLSGTIPVGLFGSVSGDPAEYMFWGTFNGCPLLTGSSALMPDGTTTLYQQFPTATGTQCDNCFKGCTGLSDAASIPTAWK